MPRVLAPSEGARARDAEVRISDKSTEIVVVRDGEELPPQWVRIEYNTSVTEISGVGGATGRRQFTIFGYKGHPSIADTDLQRNDRFAVDDIQHWVTDVIPTIGEVQVSGYAEA